MDGKHVGGGIKITYIETQYQYVTSDAADFKDLVQRLTGRSAGSAAAAAPAAPAAPQHRPRAHRAGGAMTAAGAGPQSYRYGPAGVRAAVVSPEPPCLEELRLHEMDDFSDLFFYASERHDQGFNGGCYSDLSY